MKKEKEEEIKITHEEIKNLSLLKIMIEENISLLNFLIAKEVILRHIEIDDFKEKVDLIKELIENVLDKEIYPGLINIKEVTENELREEIEDIKKIKNKKISAKYKKMLKDNLAMFFGLLKDTNMEDIAMINKIKLYPISEIEEIYKYI